MKNTIFFLFFIFFLSYVSYSQTVEIEGTTDICKKGNFYLIDVLGNRDTLCSTKINDSKFNTKINFPKNKAKKVTMVGYLIEHQEGSNSGGFFLENNEKYYVKILKSGIGEYKGTKNTNKINEYFKNLSEYSQELDVAKAKKNDSNILTAKTKISECMYHFAQKNIESDLTEVILSYVQMALSMNVLNNEKLEYYHKICSRFETNMKIAAILKKLIEAQNIIKIGNQAPDFTLLDNKNQKIRLGDIKKTYILLDFWATWCSPCIQNLPKLKKIAKKYTNLEIVGISQDKNDNKWKEFTKKQKISWINVIDSSSIISNMYLANAIPYYVLLDKDKKILVLSNNLDDVNDFFEKP